MSYYPVSQPSLTEPCSIWPCLNATYYLLHSSSVLNRREQGCKDGWEDKSGRKMRGDEGEGKWRIGGEKKAFRSEGSSKGGSWAWMCEKKTGQEEQKQERVKHTAWVNKFSIHKKKWRQTLVKKMLEFPWKGVPRVIDTRRSYFCMRLTSDMGSLAVRISFRQKFTHDNALSTLSRAPICCSDYRIM